jgi:hypothetical protein
MTVCASWAMASLAVTMAAFQRRRYTNRRQRARTGHHPYRRKDA